MSEQKAFYELPKPAKVAYIVIVRPDESTGKGEARCSYPECKDEDEYGNSLYDEVYQCVLCGDWYCCDHIGFGDACDDCMALPLPIRREVAAFRDKLNLLR